ncbi:c-type cytochrome [Hydrogenimonas sp. SS33]|uniref:c-type cytochrome n=1 Tax=Hydrogenimonas leucolamina TaxID=2954236 RepID=UPI00336BCF62
MKNNRNIVLITVLALLPLFGADKGEQIYMSKGCYGCHGTHGEGIGDYPRLAGRSQAELMRLLEQLKKGIGHTSKREMMIPFAQALDEAQMKAVTRFLSAQNPHAEEDESLRTPEDILGGSDM